jgi:L-alanine-DL-glutamate epimerase-like enolase superfamily enzyme
MQYKVFPYQLQFKHPFKIAHTLRSQTEVVYLQLLHEDIIAWGEAAFPPYVSENIETFKQFISKVNLPQNIKNLEELHTYLNAVKSKFPHDTFSICALDIALHNYLAIKLNNTISQLYALPSLPKNTSITIGMGSIEEMQQKINEAHDAHYFKLKVNQEYALSIVENFRKISDKPFVVDANQGFSNKKLALKFADFLAECKVQYLEQVFDKNDLEAHRWLKQKSKIPLIADESYQSITNLEKVAECFDGINVKLMKSGGLMEGYNSLAKAKSMGLITMLGCMSESSVAVSAASSLSALADFVDLDGPFLIKNDPFTLDNQNKIVPNFL